MKLYSIIILLLTSLHAWAVEPQNIVVKSRLDQQTSESFIKRIRTFLIHNELGDPYNQELENPVVVDFNLILRQLPPDTQSWIKDFQNLLNLKVFESVYKLRVDNFGYSIDDFHSELLPTNSGSNRIDYVTRNSVMGLRIFAEKIAFQIELNRTTSGSPIKFDIELIRPEFIVDPELIMEMPMGWNTYLIPDALFLSLQSIDLSQVFAKIVERPDLVNLVIQGLNMPNVSVRVGNREIKFDKNKIQKFMISRQDEMKAAIIDLLKARMQERFSNIIKNKPQEVFLPRTYSASGKIHAVWNIEGMDADKTNRMLKLDLDGHFCNTKAEIKEDFCQTRHIPAKLRRKIDMPTFNRSMQEVDHLILQKKANVAVSVSENYLNQLIAAAAAGGVLKLSGDDFKLGPENAFVLAEEKGPGFSLYVDIIYKLKRSDSILVGKSELRFPIKLSIGLKIVLVDSIPFLQVRVLGLKTDPQLLLNGAPQYDLVSNVNSVRFRKKVITKIMEDIQPFNDQLLLDLEMKEFKGTYMEELDFYSDGNGRGTAILIMDGEK